MDERPLVIEGVKPEIDSGRFPIKRTVGEEVVVEADVFADGHDAISTLLLYRKEGNADWIETPMEPLGNDRWRGSFTVTEQKSYYYTVMAWMDKFKTWRRDLAKKVEADQQVAVELLVGARLIGEATERALSADTKTLKAWQKILNADAEKEPARIKLALSEDVSVLMEKYTDRRSASQYSKELEVKVEREKARFSTWYEMFPRSTANEPGRHGTFKDCEARLPYIAEMGFDVLYLPPIHPVGHTHRKGRNNSLKAGPNDPGTPWAIGSEEGGHKSINPELGTLKDFRSFVDKAKKYNIEIALDIAFQCSPDHPYIKEHPEWFKWRPDGTIQYAENPPKKYQDIYPLNFETDSREELWTELKSIILFWIEQGIRIFRVDNPHTKPFPFWEWIIAEIRKDYPDVVFLAEAFTRPKIMYRLAKLGYNQSYTYFTWRNTKWELTQYFTELTRTDVHEFFRPNVWTNTPDILTEYLQSGGHPAFMTRLILAATLAASYGIYGPAFELCENTPREPGSEEYLNSEKYEIKHWPIDREDSLKDFIARVNRIRVNNPALHSNESLDFHTLSNEQLICYSKKTKDLSNVIVVVVNLDPHHTQTGWVDLPLSLLGIPEQQPFQVYDLLSNAGYIWNGPRNYVELNPHICPGHMFLVRKKVRDERDFDYYL